MKAKIRSFFKHFLDREFLVPTLVLLVGQAATFYGLKLLDYTYNVFTTALDIRIPFIPEFIYVYNAFYPVILLCLYIIYLHDKKMFKHTIMAGILGFLISDIIFIWYPVIMIRPDLDNIVMDKVTRFVIGVTYAGDNPPSNCFPSIHCLFCFQMMLSIILCKNIKVLKKVIIAIMAFLIAVSIFFVKQHYVYDMILALLLVIVVNIVVYYLYKISRNK